MRINKYIANSGSASRRGADELIKQGKVKVNGKVVTDLATIINEDNDTVVVDGIKISASVKPIYIMFNKPKGCVCTLKDDKDRKTVMDYLTDFSNRRIFPIGRLDYNTEGLLLLTNDGDLSYKLTHPSNEIPKTYSVKVATELTESDAAKLRKGIVLDGMKLQPCKIKPMGVDERGLFRYDVTIFEGKNRQLHRMFAEIGKEILFLKRVSVGSLRLGGLSRGTYRYLTDKEVAELQSY